MTGATPPASWYEDPWHEAARRWWDGNAWTGHVAAAGSMLERESIGIALDLPSRACRLTDSEGTLIGSLDVAGSSPAAAPGTSATPQPGELMVATPGDLVAPAGQPQGGAQRALPPSAPVPIRDVDGRQLFTLRAEQPGPSRPNAGVSLHGPDGAEVGRYDIASRKGGQTVELHHGGQLVATIARDRTAGAGRRIAVRGVDGAALATVGAGDHAPGAPTVTVTAALIAPLTGPVRYLVICLPLAVISLAVALIPAMPAMSMMPPMVAGTRPAMPSAADVGSRLMEVVIARFFDSLGDS